MSAECVFGVDGIGMTKQRTRLAGGDYSYVEWTDDVSFKIQIDTLRLHVKHPLVKNKLITSVT